MKLRRTIIVHTINDTTHNFYDYDEKLLDVYYESKAIEIWLLDRYNYKDKNIARFAGGFWTYLESEWV